MDARNADIAKEHRRLITNIAMRTVTPFESSVDGCTAAREFLTSRGYEIDERLTGWEIIHQANELLKDEAIRKFTLEPPKR